MIALTVDRQTTCVGDIPCPVMHFRYDWDEVGRLMRARRWDMPNWQTVPPPDDPEADLSFAYDASDQRVRKTSGDLHTLYIFGSLELRRAAYDPVENAYQRDAQTEVPYLQASGVRLARVVNFGATTRVYLELGDHLGSTSVVLDHATGELVERSTAYAYGAVESDYRPDKWGEFREEYRFTGKEDDIEVGLTYFGKRYYAPLLGRWISADPLAVHVAGAGDLNLYAYVHGRVLVAVDPVGLEEQIVGQDGGALHTYNPETGVNTVSIMVVGTPPRVEPAPPPISGPGTSDPFSLAPPPAEPFQPTPPISPLEQLTAGGPAGYRTEFRWIQEGGMRHDVYVALSGEGGPYTERQRTDARIVLFLEAAVVAVGALIPGPADEAAIAGSVGSRSGMAPAARGGGMDAAFTERLGKTSARFVGGKARDIKVWIKPGLQGAVRAEVRAHEAVHVWQLRNYPGVMRLLSARTSPFIRAPVRIGIETHAYFRGAAAAGRYGLAGVAPVRGVISLQGWEWGAFGLEVGGVGLAGWGAWELAQ